ncbi:LuxR C-terminal-related transcriptional regulator [Paractinoplanes maris]|uniref:LuxR C-terminal-related transcriptional regulator n=1 Tax=Paractinoplanes maris TaxID=1734446 RepID=UPI0027E0B108|nr:LuxR C-terminal-related transcriptional regulator [Actinoplanes maris]
MAARRETLWAGCLPLTSMTAPLLPLREVLRRAGLSDDVTLVAFDAWLDRATADRPVVLVVDDLQWADRSTLDVLLYTIAGRADRGLGLIATVRAGAEGDWLSWWFADVLRLPRVRELPLGRLDRAGTDEQIAGVFGRPADQGLVDEVHTRTGGNPYLTDLLVRDLDPRAVTLPPTRPAHLRDAVIRPWRSMSAPARELTRIVAVGGHPQAYEPLVRTAPSLGFADPVLPALREAVDAAVLLATADRRYWFTHPLLAEVLDDELLPDQRRQMHAAYASVLDDTDPVNRADHYARAGLTEPAFRWALRAADATTRPAEQLRLFRRALSLRASLDDPGLSEADLWERIRLAADRAGLYQAELEAVEALIGLVPPGSQPLRSGRLMSRRAVLRIAACLDGPNIELRRAAHAITASHPDSADHARTTAQLAQGLLWAGDPSGVPLAARALELAERCGDEETVATALLPSASAKFLTGDPGFARDAQRAWELGLRLGRPEILKGATYAVVNTFQGPFREMPGLYRRAAEELTARGAAHTHVAEMCAWEAFCLLWTGDWRACRQRLRVALGAQPGVRADALSRLTAAKLACLQGRQAEAEAHVARADEVFTAPPAARSFLGFVEVQVHVALGGHEPEAAFENAVAEMERTGYAEELLPLAARALADRAEADRDAGRDPAPVLELLAEFGRRFPAVAPDPNAELAEGVAHAYQLLTAAETARATRDPGELALWRSAAEAFHRAEFPWDEAYARWRQAQAALRDRRTHRLAPDALRHAHRLATDLAAVGLLTDLERLARTARIDLTEADRAATPPPDLPGLTSREREVLAHLLTGGTNTEIAKALVLSEKTIGVHVSNMLRKTGTANRIQLAELARRHRNRKI